MKLSVEERVTIAEKVFNRKIGLKQVAKELKFEAVLEYLNGTDSLKK